MTRPAINGQTSPGQPAPIFTVQLILLESGDVQIVTPREQPLDSPEHIALAALTMAKAQSFLQQVQFPQKARVVGAPPGLQVPRNPGA